MPCVGESVVAYLPLLFPDGHKVERHRGSVALGTENLTKRCLQGLHANVVVRSQGRPRREPEDPTGGSLVTDSVLHQLRAHHSLSDLATLVVRHL